MVPDVRLSGWRTWLVRVLPGLGLAAILLGHALGWWTLAPVRQLDAWIHDARLRLTADAAPESRVAIVAVDEASLTALGRWPWSRARLAELVERLFTQHGATVVGLDLLLAEPDTSSGLATLDEMARGPLSNDPRFTAELTARRADLDHDGRLAKVLQAHPVVLGFQLSRGANATRHGVLPTGLFSAADLPSLPRFDGFGGNLERLQRAAAGGGFLNAAVDPDGVRRRAPLLARLGDEVHGSFALAMAHLALGQPALRIVSRRGQPSEGPGAAAIERVTGAGLSVPVGSDAFVLLPFAAPAGLPPVYSAVDVLQGRVPEQALRSRLVVIGATAPGLADLHATPAGPHMAGAVAHASLLSAILKGRVPHEPGWTPALEAALLAGMWLAGAALWRTGLRSATIAAAALAAALCATNFAAWALGLQAWPLAGPLLLLVALFGWRVFVGHFVESHARRRLAVLFGQYVPPEWVERMEQDPSRYDMQGRNAELTVMFADLRGFTALSEAMAPADLAALINDFLSAMTDIVRQHDGTLDKYVGDAVMAFWGAPLPDESHALHAVNAALAMQAALPALNRRFALRGWPSLTLGIGINTGTVVVGDLGSRHRRAYTVLGDAVNVAARLQELTAQYGVGIIIGEATRRALGDWPCVELDRVTLRGRRTPETLFLPHSARATVAPAKESVNP